MTGGEGIPVRPLFAVPCANGRILHLGGRTVVMGILNVTPDSFSDGGVFDGVDLAVARAEAMVEEGAEIVDVGGESTRPGSSPVSSDEEIARVLPVVREIVRRFPLIPVSIDTTKAAVAKACLDEGAALVNDTSALDDDQEMASVVRDAKAAVVLMHRRGIPVSMQEDPRYRYVVTEVVDLLAERIRFAVEAGIPSASILVDPGIGFGKTADHNLSLQKHLDAFHALGHPIVFGSSRKSFLGFLTGRGVPVERGAASLASASHAILKGAHIVRVHDVAAAVDAARVLDAIISAV